MPKGTPHASMEQPKISADTVEGISLSLNEARFRALRSTVADGCRRGAKLVVQLAFLAGVCYLGNAISQNLALPVPGNIISMGLLLGLLVTGMLHSSKIDLASGMLLKYMPVFFIPAGVSVMGCFPVIRDHLWQFGLVCVITTVLVYLAASSTVTFMLHLTRPKALVPEADAPEDESGVRA